MGKRTAPETDPRADQDARHLKRQRVGNSLERNSPRPGAPVVEEVTSPRQLQKALVFDKGAIPAFRSGMYTLIACCIAVTNTGL
jgi:nucleolar pre-ribosomal-associated protein 1